MGMAVETSPGMPWTLVWIPRHRSRSTTSSPQHRRHQQAPPPRTPPARSSRQVTRPRGPRPRSPPFVSQDATHRSACPGSEGTRWEPGIPRTRCSGCCSLKRWTTSGPNQTHRTSALSSVRRCDGVRVAKSRHVGRDETNGFFRKSSQQPAWLQRIVTLEPGKITSEWPKSCSLDFSRVPSRPSLLEVVTRARACRHCTYAS